MHFDNMERGNMPLKGEYEPSKAQIVRDQVELYESSGGTEGTTLGVLVAREEDEHLRTCPSSS